MSTEGRFEHQKPNQTAALLSFSWVFGFQLDSLEKHLITLTGVAFTFAYGIVLLSFWCSTRPSADTGTDQDQNDNKKKSAISNITI